MESHEQKSGLLYPDRLDAMAYDEHQKTVILAIFETRQWDLGDLQLLQLQEKLNAYASFILDGEMEETYPDLIDKKICIQLRTVHEPSDAVLAMAPRVREQLALQDIDFEIVVISDEKSSCGCDCC